MTGLRVSLQALLFPHQRAERLMEDRLELEISGPDDHWLDRHLESCRRCRAAYEQREAVFAAVRGLPELRAPEGFAERVRIAAAGQSSTTVSARSPWAHRWMALAAVSAALLLVVFGAPLLPEGGAGRSVGVQLGGAGVLEELPPHFIVRAPGQGAARVRSMVTSVLEEVGGSSYDVEGGIQVVLPRPRLVTAMAALERRGTLEVILKNEPGVGTSDIILLFELL